MTYMHIYGKYTAYSHVWVLQWYQPNNFTELGV